MQVPNFGEILAAHLGGVTPDALPYLLSRLERTAADRYRGWAEDLPAYRDGLLECAGREDEIADRIEQALPPSDAGRAAVDAVIPEAKATYYAVFDGHPPIDQVAIQAGAERQGSMAWQNLKAAHPELGELMDALTALELESADYLDEVVLAG